MTIPNAFRQNGNGTYSIDAEDLEAMYPAAIETAVETTPEVTADTTPVEAAVVAPVEVAAVVDVPTVTVDVPVEAAVTPIDG